MVGSCCLRVGGFEWWLFGVLFGWVWGWLLLSGFWFSFGVGCVLMVICLFWFIVYWFTVALWLLVLFVGDLWLFVVRVFGLPLYWCLVGVLA